ncbi:MAG: hypothetical protein FJY92_01185, partial [Candidatus Hydrogenedentes bacterium]|nr:hypothetical protein [Candidatus Hydrogenedentota bacterium]
MASATTFLTGALVARACTKSEFGLYTMGFSLLALLLTVQTSLIATPFMVKLPRLSPAEARRLAGNSLIHQILFGVLAAIVVVAFGGVVNVNDTALGKMLLALGAALSFLLLRDYIRQYGFARLEYARVLAFDVQLAVLQCAGLAALWAAGVLSAATAFLVLGAASALTALHWSFVTRTQRTLSRKALLADLANNWSSGKWLLASGLVWAVGMN